MRIHSLEPIEDRNAEVLILGSIPGRASLMAGQYYAHARNAFWPIMAELLQFEVAAPYRVRIRALRAARIALWDVLHSCVREGSLDSGIERDTQSANDFPAFFRGHPKISHVFFNGGTAEACYRRQVMGWLEGGPIGYARLPSTSPAHASRSFAEKLRAWRAILSAGGENPRNIPLASALHES